MANPTKDNLSLWEKMNHVESQASQEPRRICRVGLQNAQVSEIKRLEVETMICKKKKPNLQRLSRVATAGSRLFPVGELPCPE